MQVSDTGRGGQHLHATVLGDRACRSWGRFSEWLSVYGEDCLGSEQSLGQPFCTAGIVFGAVMLLRPQVF